MTAPKAPCVVLVMKALGNLRVMQQALDQCGMQNASACSERELELLLADPSCDAALALVDVTGFGDAAWSICAKLHERELPFIVLSQPADLETGSRSLQYGARSVLQKPVAKSALLQLIRSLTEPDSPSRASTGGL